MENIKAMKILISEKEKISKRRDNVLEKVGRYNHYEGIIDELLSGVARDLNTLEEVEEYLQREDVQELKK